MGCEERDLDVDGTKKDLVHLLLEWRDRQHDLSSASDTEAAQSDASIATARASDTKTAALNAAAKAGRVGSGDKTPLLMRSKRRSSPDKPKTSPQSKNDEQEEA